LTPPFLKIMRAAWARVVARRVASFSKVETVLYFINGINAAVRANSDQNAQVHLESRARMLLERVG